MFIVFNKEKINSYLISIGTVMILFSMTFMINKNMDTVETSASQKEETYVEINDNTLINDNSVNNINLIINSVDNLKNDVIRNTK